MSDLPDDATSLLAAVSSGDQEAKKKLFSILYAELHQLAHFAMRKEPSKSVMQTTALIHEAYIRLVNSKEIRFQNRAHFLKVAVKAMRRLLVDQARKRMAAKRGGKKSPRSLESVMEPDRNLAVGNIPFEKLDLLDKALRKLEAQEDNKRRCMILELHYFAGLTHDQTAEVLEISKATVRRELDFIKVLIFHEMQKEDGDD